MSETAKFYAYGFPNDELYTSVFNDEAIKAITLSSLESCVSELQDEKSVLCIYCNSFEVNLIDFLNIFSKTLINNPIVIIGENHSQSYLENLFEQHPFTYIKLPSTKGKIIEELLKAKEGKCSFIPKYDYKERLEKAKANLVAFHEVATALTGENNIEKLLNLILTKSRYLAKADAGSLYLKENDNKLRFVLTQNTSCHWSDKKDIVMDINEKSISGYTAKTAKYLNMLDVYSIPETFPFTYNRSFDINTGYRNKSMLTVPMYNNKGEILGVIQLINKRKDFEQRVKGKKLEEDQIIPFDYNDFVLLDDLASLAAVAFENAKLYYNIRKMFEGFVKASNTTIEAKDPCTNGHSERVADLTVAMAKTINNINEGKFADIHFDDKELLQIRYASLLHDFGKINVNEEVLTKSKKLFPYELDSLKSRYQSIKKSIESDYYKECLDYISANGLDKYILEKQNMEDKFNSQIKEIDETIELLVKSNEPTVLEEGCSTRIAELASKVYKDKNGNEIPYLTERESSALSVKRGSLTEAERIEIESHVKHSYNFLSKIPWTKDLERVPEIAYNHHEKLNGRGYPNHKSEKEIPIESQMMGIADIFDALTAQDRPYKPALPLKKALDILRMNANNNDLNKDLVDLFESKEVYKCLEEKPLE